MDGSRRGGGGTGAGAGGGLSWYQDPRFITFKLLNANRPQDILHVVKKITDDELLELNHIHVSAAINRLGKTGRTRPFSTRRRLAMQETFQELLRLARRFAEKQTLGAQAVANITHGLATLRGTGWFSGGGVGCVF